MNNPLENKTVAIIGYGAQGRSHALNLRDSGVSLVIGQREGTGFNRALDDGFDPVPIARAVEHADVISILLPDEVHATVFQSSISPGLSPSKTIVFCHGFSVHYGLVTPPKNVPCILVAPKGAGHRVRSAFEEGSGVPCLVGIAPGTDSAQLGTAYAYAAALGCPRERSISTTFADETETDLFGEQVVLCGGVIELMKLAYQTLVAAGYKQELAYFECIHELKLVVDLIHEGGLAHMRDHISNTAEFGGYVNGPRVIGEQSKEAMQSILEEIRNGQFAKKWIADGSQNTNMLLSMRHQEAELQINGIGDAVRKLDEAGKKRR